jgi:hypothetical protein
MRFSAAAAAAVNEKIFHISLTASFVILLVLVPRGLFGCCLLGLELFHFLNLISTRYCSSHHGCFFFFQLFLFIRYFT